jgi:type I restriction enzyme, S subunit
MNTERFLAHYERIADAPDATARLRRFILDLAVRGKLVQQDPKDEPASEFLKRLTKQLSQGPQKSSLRDRNQAAVEPNVGIPLNWLWVRIGDHLELINGMAFKPTDWQQSGIKIVRIQNLNRLDAPFNYCDPKSVRDRFLIDDGAFLISWSGTPGTSFGAFIWDRGPAVLNQHIFRCDFRVKAFDVHYLRIAINGRLDEMIAKAHGGVGLQHITKGKLEALLIALPPIAEQHRIVAKVDELMALCDRLEAARATRESRRERLSTASLARLNVPDPDQITFAGHARFVINNLADLSTRTNQIKQLRQTILNLAVRGKLVPQDPNDEPASELLQLLNSETRRRKSEVPKANSDGVAFPCPSGWEWTTVQGLLAQNREISYGVIKLGDEPKSGGVPTLRCSDVKPGFIDLSAVRKVSEVIEGEYARTRLCGGEILINIRGTLGGVAKVPETLHGYNVAREVAVVPISADIVANFIVYLMLSQYFWDAIQENLRGIAYKGLNLGILREFPIPLPPVAEQHRIVAKVDELMAMCDQLEKSLAAGDNIRRRLFDALLAEALGTGNDAIPAEAARIAAHG